MRVGQNPAKFVKTVPQPERITVAIVTYIPFLGGYYAQSLDVLKTCLESLWKNTTTSYDLMVFDNASCNVVREYLNQVHREGKIQYLVLSDQNVGKASAWNFIFAAAPGEIIAYADSDIFFHPGWLSALTKVIDTFPQVGMVTGMPMWSPEKFSTATVEWASHHLHGTLERGKLLAWEDYWRHAQSLGQDEETARHNYSIQEDVCFTYQGNRYHIGAGHFQFVAKKGVLQQVIPIPADRPMGQVRRLDIAINEKGYLRLATPQWWVHHLGNTLGETSHIETPKVNSPKRGLKNIPLIRTLVHWVYHRAFEFLYK